MVIQASACRKTSITIMAQNGWMVSYPSGYRIMFKEYICHAKLSFSDILICSEEPAGIHVSTSNRDTTLQGT